MIRIHQGARTKPPSIKGRNMGRNAYGWQDKDPLDDTGSYALVRTSESLRGKTAEAKEERVPNQTKEMPPTRVE